MLWVVEVGESYRCSGTIYTVIVEADDEESASQIALEWGKKIDKGYRVKDVEKLTFEDGVAQVAYEEW